MAADFVDEMQDIYRNIAAPGVTQSRRAREEHAMATFMYVSLQQEDRLAQYTVDPGHRRL